MIARGKQKGLSGPSRVGGVNSAYAHGLAFSAIFLYLQMLILSRERNGLSDTHIGPQGY
jgi:hypothetical protein